MKITKKEIFEFQKHLIYEEKATATREKYLRDVNCFYDWVGDREVDKNMALEYKQKLMESYSYTSVNTILSSINSFFEFCGRHELKLKTLKVQKQIFASCDKELTKNEYRRLLDAAKSKKKERLCLVMQTVCSTGIRISELKYITTESLGRGFAIIRCKGKTRQVFLPQQLCKQLLKYVSKMHIAGGSVFVTKNGQPLDRSNIWSEMKKLCKIAGVAETKVFPHNLRHLFARTYYTIQKDIVRLADILGHASVNTTRIYTMETGEIHRMQIQKLGLLKC